MSNNYPPGAAHDPDAPYNEPIARDVDITVSATMVKETSLMLKPFVDHHDVDIGNEFIEQCRTPEQIIEDCMRICRELIMSGCRIYAGIRLMDLKQDCEGWAMEDINVTST